MAIELGAPLELPHFKPGIDLDDVVFQTAPLTIDMHNEWHGTQLTMADWYDVDGNLEHWGVSESEEAFVHVDEILASDEFADRVEPVEGALEMMDEAGDFDGVTGRPVTLEEVTYAALAKHFPGKFDRGNVDFTNYRGVLPARSKSVVVIEKGLTNFFEDLPRHANDLVANGIRTVLFGKYPWNQAGTYRGLLREIHPLLITAPDMDAVREFIRDEKALIANLAPGERLPLEVGKRHY